MPKIRESRPHRRRERRRAPFRIFLPFSYLRVAPRTRFAALLRLGAQYAILRQAAMDQVGLGEKFTAAQGILLKFRYPRPRPDR